MVIDMSLYELGANIRDLFKPTIIAPNVGTDAVADAKFLAGLAAGTAVLYANNGMLYWYYFIADVANRDVVEFLFNRNGLAPQYHLSRYYSVAPAFRNHGATYLTNVSDYVLVDHMFKHPVFRMRTRSLDKNPQFNDFINSIESDIDKYTVTPAIMAHLRENMAQQSR